MTQLPTSDTLTCYKPVNLVTGEHGVNDSALTSSGSCCSGDREQGMRSPHRARIGVKRQPCVGGGLAWVGAVKDTDRWIQVITHTTRQISLIHGPLFTSVEYFVEILADIDHTQLEILIRAVTEILYRLGGITRKDCNQF